MEQIIIAIEMIFCFFHSFVSLFRLVIRVKTSKTIKRNIKIIAIICAIIMPVRNLYRNTTMQLGEHCGIPSTLTCVMRKVS